MILAIVGPTGVGKTKLSIELAHKYDAIIINTDATQVYRDLNIGSAKISEEEKEGIKHYLIDIKDITEEYSVFDFQKDARKIIEENKDKNIIFVGGTGLYLKAALYDYEFSNFNDLDLSSYSNQELYEMALLRDKNMSIHPNNRIRLENFLKKESIEKKEPVKLYDHIIIGLTTDRDNLYDIINKRVDDMINNGLLDEVKSLIKYQDKSLILKRAIGYKELIAYLNGELTLNEAIDLIKKNSRHYAKRQYTFFNHQLNVNWFNVNYDNFNHTIHEVTEFIERENNHD